MSSMETRITETVSGCKVAQASEAVLAFMSTVLSISSIWALDLTPIPHQAWVAVGAFPIYAVAEVSVSAWRANLQAVFTEVSRGTHLVTPGAVPAPVTGDAASLQHLAGLLTLTVTTPVPAVLSVEASWTRLPAELPSEPRPAGAGAVGLVTASMDTLAHALAVSAPQTVPALTPARQLLTRRAVTGTRGVADLPIPARAAVALACEQVTHGVGTAVTLAGTLVSPEALVARAHARLLVAGAHQAAAGMLTAGAPVLGVAGTGSGDVITLPIRVAGAFTFTVRPPVLGRAFHITGSSKVTMATAAFVGTNTNFVVFAGEVALTEW